MSRSRPKQSNHIVLQKNVVLWSGAFLAVLLVSLEPQEGVMPSDGLAVADVNGAVMVASPPAVTAQSLASLPATSEAVEPLNATDGIGNGYEWLSSYRTGLSPAKKRQLAVELYRESLRHGFRPELVMALIAVESSFFNWSRSEQGAIGLMQLQPVTAESVANRWVSASGGSGEHVSWRGEEMLFDPMINLRLGLKYLADLRQRFGDLKTALTAYNYGPTRVSEWLAQCDPLPLDYANRVLGLSEELKNLPVNEEAAAPPLAG